MNKAIICGNLSKDPDLRSTANGKDVCSFTLVTSSKYNDTETKEFHKIVSFGKTATNVNNYLKKGSQALVEGKISTRSYEKEGNKHYITEIVAEKVEFLK